VFHANELVMVIYIIAFFMRCFAAARLTEFLALFNIILKGFSSQEKSVSMLPNVKSYNTIVSILFGLH